MKIDPAVLVRQFRFWAGHCSLNALPSFLIALIWLELWKSPAGILAMLAAVATFIVLYSVATSLRGPLSDPESALSRALRVGLKLRCWISVLSVPVVLIPGLAILAPDLWCGFLATMVLETASNAVGLDFNVDMRRSMSRGMTGPDFLSVYATTLLEGFILSFLLAMISFFALAFMQMAERRKAFRYLLPPEKR